MFVLSFGRILFLIMSWMEKKRGLKNNNRGEKMEKIVRELEAIRLKKGMSIEEISESIGMCKATIAGYLHLTAKTSHNWKTIRKIASCIDPDYVVPDRYIKCDICGKEFKAETLATRICSKECKKNRVRLYYEEYKANPRVTKRKTQTSASLNQVSLEADLAGMSYGKYVSMMEGRV